MSNKKGRWVIEALGLLLSLVVIIPFYMILVNSFKNKEDAALVNLHAPTQWQAISNYITMFQEGGVWTAFKNSILLTVPSVLVIILLCAMTAFVLQRRKHKASSLMSSLIVLGLFVPGQIIPTYFICQYLHVSSFLAAALVLIAANIPMGVFLYMGFCKSIPTEIDESAILDGCSPLRLFFQIIYPLLQPITVTLFIITFMAIWNDFGTTIYFLNNTKNFTLTLTIFNFFGVHSSDWNLVFANVIIVSLPVIIVYFLAQKQIISGMTAGAVKG
ncbi:carbohydrate ABC transporter permease [Paenibacillus segetis]|uniref:Sugar ABC transporter permease n=1 Tax=Paenibacillus segetis TaxID=1325360 RepID=A0ABQ1YL94_9BACL|nr:carbohydrate ABC transporter permease [Paenibacillus segetis]GGH28801.1 sugar ABC transporter permease [Paenibacillus segetis]